MPTDFFTPIKSITSGIGNTQLNQTQNTDSSIFQDIFGQMIKDVVETDQVVAADVQALVTGQTDSLHQLQIDQVKAQLAIELLTQTRNRALEAYNQLMNMGV
jgi:flagellar hook-basal body complex protein FliE